MIQVLTWWEIGLAAAVFVLAGSEVIQLVRARREGRTRNVSRLFTHGILMALLLLYVAYTVFRWWGFESRPLDPTRGSTHNWTYIILGITLGLLVVYELLGVVRARVSGLTTNLSRVLAHATMLLVLVVLLSISFTKWNLYLDAVAETYRESIRSGGED